MAAPESRRQRSPACARIALIIALLPVFAAVMLAIATPFLITDDCVHAGDLMVCSAGHGNRDEVLRAQERLPGMAWISVPLGVALFFACRYFGGRGTGTAADQSGREPPGDLPSSDVK